MLNYLRCFCRQAVHRRERRGAHGRGHQRRGQHPHHHLDQPQQAVDERPDNHQVGLARDARCLLSKNAKICFKKGKMF